MRKWQVGNDKGVTCEVTRRLHESGHHDFVEIWGPAGGFAFGELKALACSQSEAQRICDAMNLLEKVQEWQREVEK